NYTVYFHAEFSKPLKNFGVWSIDMEGFNLHVGDDLISDRFQSDDFYERAGRARVLKGCTEMEAPHIGFFTEFETTAGEQVLMKAGISFVDIEGERANLAHDIPDWNFDEVRRQARKSWDS